MLLCIDIGNTHTHYGVVGPEGARFLRHLPTRQLDHLADGIGARFAGIFAEQPGVIGVAFCSVVPDATEKLLRVFDRWRLSLPFFQLTHDKKLGVPIGYPRPEEIGQDRLANAAGAHAVFGTPAVVIDMGTAVTFDVVTRSRGFEGGIIAPGLELMRRYLHEQTALLPKLDEGIDLKGVIGQSTVEAMRIGTVIGFGGMVQALLDAVLKELEARGEKEPTIIGTGSAAPLLERTLGRPFRSAPDITLRGLAAAWHLNH
jgi:type III pantothenate kinase